MNDVFTAVCRVAAVLAIVAVAWQLHSVAESIDRHGYQEFSVRLSDIDFAVDAGLPEIFRVELTNGVVPVAFDPVRLRDASVTVDGRIYVNGLVGVEGNDNPLAPRVRITAD